MGSFYFRPYKSTRLITKYMIWEKLFSLVSFINILHVIPLCRMTFIESPHRRITDIIFCEQYWEIVPIQVTSNTMTRSAHHLILIAPYKSRRVKDMKKWIYYF